MKKNLCLLLVVLIVSLTFVPRLADAAEVVVAVDPPSYEVSEVGKSFTLDVTVSDVADLWGWSFSVRWNPSVLSLTEVTEGAFLKNKGETIFIWNSYNQSALDEGYLPEVNCALFSAETVSGDGVLASLVFKATGSGTSQIILENVHLLPDAVLPTDTSEIDHSSVNGEVKVTSSSADSTSSSSSSSSDASPSTSSSPSDISTEPPTTSNLSSSPSTSLITAGSFPDFYLILTIVVVVVGVVTSLMIIMKKTNSKKEQKNQN